MRPTNAVRISFFQTVRFRCIPESQLQSFADRIGEHEGCFVCHAKTEDQRVQILASLCNSDEKCQLVGNHLSRARINWKNWPREFLRELSRRIRDPIPPRRLPTLRLLREGVCMSAPDGQILPELKSFWDENEIPEKDISEARVFVPIVSFAFLFSRQAYEMSSKAKQGVDRNEMIVLPVYLTSPTVIGLCSALIAAAGNIWAGLTSIRGGPNIPSITQPLWFVRHRGIVLGSSMDLGSALDFKKDGDRGGRAKKKRWVRPELNVV